MILPWENFLAVLKLLSLLCSSDLPSGTLSTCLSGTPILGSGHALLYPLDTVPTTLKYFSLYVPLTVHPLLRSQEKNIPTLATSKIHYQPRPSREYTFLLNLHMHAFPCVCTSNQPIYKLQHLKHSYGLDHTHTPMQLQTHTYTCFLKHLCCWSQILFLSSQH